jgi:Domain of unknown function (DU1801)
MAKNKTVETQSSVRDFVMTIADDKKRSDFEALIKIITDNTGFDPTMWGTVIVGFGSYHYQYESGREGDAPLVGIAPRANAITFYLGSFAQKDGLLSKFGKYKTGKSCIYIQKIEDIDKNVLIEMVKNAVNRKE